MRLLPAALAFGLVAAATAPVHAQIHAWRDANGTLVLSNVPRTEAGSEITTYAVTGSTIRTTRPSTERASRYDDLIQRYAGEYGIAPDLVRAVIQAESGFNPYAVSTKGAMGLMQLMPATARELGVSNPFMPDQNIRGGVSYLARLLQQFDQNLELALAAYNAGPGSVARYGNTVPPYRETQEYVKKITARPGVETGGPPATVIYKWIEVVNGQPMPRYSNVPPKGIPFEIVK